MVFPPCINYMVSKRELKVKELNQNPTLDSEWGSFRNVRFLVSSVGSKDPNSSALGADVLNIFVAAKEAYACIYQDGASAEFIYVDP